MLRFEKRDKTPIQLRVLVPICSVLLGLLIGSVVMLFAHVNPLRVYGAIVKGAFGSAYTFSETLVIAVPLILMSVGLCLVYRMKFFNIGAKGQYIIGAICGSYLALFLSLIHISEPTRLGMISYAVFCLKTKKSP